MRLARFERYVVARAVPGEANKFVASNRAAYENHALPVIKRLRASEGISAIGIEYKYDESLTDNDSNDFANLMACCYLDANSSKLRLVIFPAGEIRNTESLNSDPLVGIIRPDREPTGWQNSDQTAGTFEVSVQPEQVQKIIADTLLDISVSNSPIFSGVINRYINKHGRASFYRKKAEYLAAQQLMTFYGPSNSSAGYIPLAAAARLEAKSSDANMATVLANYWTDFLQKHASEHFPDPEAASLEIKANVNRVALDANDLKKAIVSARSSCVVVVALKTSGIRTSPQVRNDITAVFKANAKVGSFRVFSSSLYRKNAAAKRLADRDIVSVTRSFVRV